MKICLNGQEIQCTVNTLYDLLVLFEFDLLCVATAVNGEFIARHRYSTTVLKEGQKIEVLSPMQGG